MREIITFLLFSLVFNVITCSLSGFPIYDSDYNSLLGIRGLFTQVQDFFHTLNQTTQLYDFCSGAQPFFMCEDNFIDNQFYLTVNSIELSGKPGNVCYNFQNFYSIQRLSLKNIDCSTFNFSLLNPSSLSCENCNINTWQEAFERIELSSLILNNNPLEVTLNLNKLKKSYLSLYNTGIYANKFIKILNDLESVVQYFIFEIMLTDNSITWNNLMITNGKFYITNNATQIDFNFLTGLNIRQITIFSDNLYSANFPSIVSKITDLKTENINFNPPTVPISLLNSKLVGISIINSPNFNINGKSPFSEVNGNIPLSLENCNLTVVPDFFNSKLKFVSLKRNKFTGQLPIYTQVQEQYVTRILSYNSFTGSIPDSYCSIQEIQLDNNNLNGELQQCFSCYINNLQVRNKFLGNNFSNYQDGSTNYPPCTSISIKEVGLFESNSGFTMTGISFPRDGVSVSSIPPLNTIGFSTNTALNLITSLVGREYFVNLKNYVNITIFFNDTSQTSKSVPIKYSPPSVYSVYKSPTPNGYTFSFLGKALDRDLNTTIKFDDIYNCILKGGTNYEIRCDINTPNMIEKTYNIKFTFGTYNFTVLYQFTREYPIISSIKPTNSKTGGEITLYGYFGLNLTNISASYINDEKVNIVCNITSVTSTIVSCILPKDIIKPGSIVLYVNNLSSSFFYISSDSFQNSCPKCVNGFCSSYGSDSMCQCYKGYAGPTCNDIASNSDIVINNNSTTISQDKINFEISIRSIQEVAYNSSVIREIFLTKWNQAQRTDPNTWNYYIKLAGNTTISYSVFKAPQDMVVQFAGVDVKLSKDSIKISVNISQWDFLSALNLLQLTMQSNVNADSECETSIESEQNQLNAINYFSIERDGKILYGKFIDQMLSDGKPTYSSTKILSKSKNEIIVGIEIPHCNECILDPDFSVLVNTRSECVKSSKKTWLIPTVVVVSVIGGLSLIIMGIYLLKKFKWLHIGKSHIVFFNLTIKK